MDFEFTSDQIELRANARAVLEAACPAAVVRAVYEATGDGTALWSRLVQLDWPGLTIPEEHGGMGLGMVELAIVVEELGRAVAPTPVLATLTQLVPLLQAAGSPRLLDEIAAGACTGTLALAEDGGWHHQPMQTTARRDGHAWVLNGVKSHVLDGTTADWLAVVAQGNDGVGAFLVPAAAVVATAVVVMDPTLPIATVTLNDVTVGGDDVLLEPGDPAAARAIERALQTSVTALACSTVASCRRLFEITLDYAKQREQFGRPIGSFQALKHRLADLYLSVERAASLAWFAALTIAEDDDRRAIAVAMAKAAAGECQRLVVRDALQLHGGIGFTWEHDLHFLLKRAKAGDALLGTAAYHRAHLAELLGLAQPA